MLPDEEPFRVECFLQTSFKIALKNGVGLSNIRQWIFKKINNTLCVAVVRTKYVYKEVPSSRPTYFILL